MQPIQQIMERLGRIDDAALAGAGEAQTVQQAYRELAFTEWEGLALRAPAAMDLGAGQGFPVLISWSHDAKREREVVLGDNAVVISNRLDGKGCWFTPLFPPRTHKVPQPGRRPPPVPTPDAATPAGSMGVRRLDLVAEGAIPRQAGRYAVRVISYDWISNAVTTVLSGGPQSPAAPGPGSEDRLASWSVRGRGAPDALPSFVRGPRTPSLSGPGIAVSLPPNAAVKGGPVPVYGAVRLPVASGWRAGGAGPTAVEDAYLVLVRRGFPSPLILDIEVPLWAPAGAAPGTLAEGCFAYDLAALAGGRLTASLWQVYAILGASIAGPSPLNVTE